MDKMQAVALPLMEHFCTLQGEGRFTGQATYFLRLGGCDVGCVWCDVKESWDSSKHPMVPVDAMVEWVVASGVQIAVITGGEPLMHDLTTLTAALKEKGIRTHVETSGAHPLSGVWDWICLSPKKFNAPLPEMIASANELKVVLYNKTDFDWAEKYAGLVNDNCLLYLQPEWSRSAQINPEIISYIKHHPQWILSLQTHKYIDIP
jgi:organic radical activating enzyme